MLLVMLIVGVHHILSYVRRIQNDPSKSLVVDVDFSKGFEPPEDDRMTRGRVAVLGVFALAVSTRGRGSDRTAPIGLAVGAAVGLGLVIALNRNKPGAGVSDLTQLKW